MNSDIKQINSAVAGVDSKAADLLRTLGVGKLGYSPIPVPLPHSSMPYDATHWVVPLGLSPASDPEAVFWLPTDPMVAVTAANSIVMREVANGGMRGTVKELWRHDDMKVTIAGLLMTDDRGSMVDYQREIVRLCGLDGNVIVTCGQLNDVLGITRLAITGVDFAATAGEDCQLFTIKAVSDESYNLQIE